MRPRRSTRNARLLRSCLLVTGSGLAISNRSNALTINLSYDSTVTSLSYASSVETATQYAAQQIENLFSDNITLNIDVTSSAYAFGGSGYSLGYPYSYSTIRSDLIASASTSTDTTAYATLPSSPDPTGGGTFALPSSQQKALGLIAGNGTGNDGTFVFGNNIPWTFDSNNRAASGYWDFIGVAEHELTEIMGRNGGLGQGSPALYRTSDLFRYTGVGQRNFNQATTNSYFSIDGGVTDLMDWPDGTEMDWAPGLNDAFDAASVQGTENDITPADVALMDVIGYHALTSPVINHVGAGNWSVTSSWNQGHVPTAGQGVYLCYGDGVSRNITYDYTGSAITLYSVQLDLQGGTGSATTKLSMSANNLTVNGFEIIGRVGSGSFNQSGGTNTVNGSNGLFLGYNAGSTGTYSLSGTGTLSVSQTEFIGNSGTGAFTQNAGSNSAFAIVIANNAGSLGTYYLGSGSISTPDHEIIGGSGNGTFTQSGGGNSYSSYLTVADQPGSTGQYNMIGGTLQGSYLGAGQQGNGTFNQTAGTVTITDHLSDGDHPGSTGLYTLSGSAQLNANYEYIAYEGNGTFTQTGGSNTSSDYLNVADQPGSVGQYNMQGGTMQTGYMGAGQQGQGTVTQSAGTITVTDHLSVGDHPGSTGMYTLSGTGHLIVPFQYVAYEGTGTFTQTGGTYTNNGSLSIGVFGGSNGTVNFSGGTATISGSAYVGGWGGGAGDSGTITVSNSANLTIDGTLQVYSPGKVNINGGTTTVGALSIDSGGIVNINKQLTIDYGAGNQSPLPSIQSWLLTGYHNGAWTGAGINSSNAQTDPGHAIGYIDNGSSIILKYTLEGDATLDGTVNFNDLLALAANYTSTKADWAQGDFNYDGTVNFSDLLLLAGNYTATLTSDPAQGITSSFATDWALAEAEVAAVPEPASFGLLVLAAGGLVTRRRRVCWTKQFVMGS